MGLMILGVIMAAIGIIIIIRGNMPFIKTYHGVMPDRVTIHCRIEGGILTTVRIIFVLYSYLRFPSFVLIVLMLLAIALGVGLEIVLKVFK